MEVLSTIFLELQLQGVINPYQPNQIPESKACFFGRTEIVTWMEQQIIAHRRLLILRGPSFIGKTTLIHFLPQMLTLDGVIIKLPFTTSADYSTPEILIWFVQELIQQLAALGIVTPESLATATDSVSALDEIIAEFHRQRPSSQLLPVIDDFDVLLQQLPFDMASLLDVFQTLLTRHSYLYFVLTAKSISLPQLHHPLLDSAPSRQLTVLSANDALQMITKPVNKTIRFDYGVPKRIAEVNSNHPHYLTLFNHTLFANHAREGWVNLRHLDETLSEVLAKDIPSFECIWENATLIERAVLVAMASVRGTHGVFTRQEVIGMLTRQEKQAGEEVILTALESLAYRGILVKMGALSYRFYVDLFRLWLQKRFDLADILEQVTWQKPASRPEPALPPQTEAQATSRPTTVPPGHPKWRGWVLGLGALIILGLLSLGVVLAADGPTIFGLPTTNTVAVKTEEPVTFATAAPNTPTPTTGPTKTATPTPPLVVSKSLPSIAYMARRADEPWQIYVMNTDGSNAKAITDAETDDTSPVWSISGEQLAFVSRRDGNREIYITDIEGNNPRNLTNNPADDWTPAWSPDSKRIAFSSNRLGNWEIFIVDSDGSNLQQLTNTGSGNISPVWSPDGERIAYASKQDDDWEIYTMNNSGVDLRRLTDNDANDLAPIWSPNGDLIAYETNIDGNVEVYVMTASGGNPRNITNMAFANDHGPIWSPDGQRLLYYSNGDGSWDIFIADLNGGNIINLTQTPDLDEQTPVWRP